MIEIGFVVTFPNPSRTRGGHGTSTWYVPAPSLDLGETILYYFLYLSQSVKGRSRHVRTCQVISRLVSVFGGSDTPCKTRSRSLDTRSIGKPSRQ